MKELRIGLSMRETKSQEYYEIRDSISRDWLRYFKECLPNCKIIFLPNLGSDIITYIEDWNLNGFILTGGEDFGFSLTRDNTEKKIFEFSQKKSLPILGICRGFQLINKFMGGSIVKGNNNFNKHHCPTRHQINFKNKIVTVNSYHSNFIDETTIPKKINITSRCIIDNSIESFEGKNILGFMWHPERESNFSKFDLLEIKKLFKYD